MIRLENSLMDKPINMDVSLIVKYFIRFTTLSLEFKYWYLKDKRNKTLAHYAAIYGTLPNGFEERYPVLYKDAKDKCGNTVEDYADAHYCSLSNETLWKFYS